MSGFFLAFITVFTIVYFLIFILLKQGLRRINTNKTSQNKTDYKNISVIVSARNEQKNLPGLFTCFEQQKYDDLDIEFILVNDRSEDKSLELMKTQAAKDPRFKVLTIPDKIPGFAPKKRAIDTALNQAKGEIILLTDADGRPGPGWIRSFADLFNSGADMVIGYAPYVVDDNAPLARKMLALEYFSHAAIAAATTGLEFPLTCVGTNMAYLKKVYKEIGGFGKYKAFISGDDDLLLTLVRETKNYNIHYACNKESHVWNAPPRNFKQFINQRLRYASKGFSYPFKVTIGLSFYVLYNLMLFSGPFLGLFANTFYLWVSLIALVLKMMFEYNFILKAAGKLQDRRFTHLYFLTSILHIPYVLFFGIFGQFKIFKWAEKRAERGIAKNGEIRT